MEIRIKGLSKNYFSGGKTITALDKVDLTIPADRIFTMFNRYARESALIVKRWWQGYNEALGDDECFCLNGTRKCLKNMISAKAFGASTQRGMRKERTL
jgi:hypothetical protein